MKRILIVVMMMAVALSAGAATKKKTSTKPDAPAAPAKPAANKPVPAEVLTGKLTKEGEAAKAVYTLTTGTPVEKIELNYGMAKRMSINLDDFVGKDIAVTLRRSEDKSKITQILTVVTKADLKKH